MKHRIELTEEQASAFVDALAQPGDNVPLANTWLNANLPTILKTEFLVVTDEMAEEFYHFYLDFNGTPVPSFKATLQAFADRYLTPQPAEADAAPDVFEAHGLEWYRHTPGDPMPCDENRRIGFIVADRAFDDYKRGSSARGYDWKDSGSWGIIGWRPADAPAKLPRPAPSSEADALRKESDTPRTDKWEHEQECNYEVAWEENCRQLERELSEARAKVADLEKDVSKWEVAYLEWSDKTEWVREACKSYTFRTIGIHIADIMKQRIEQLENTVTEMDKERQDLFNAMCSINTALGVEAPPGALLAIQALQAKVAELEADLQHQTNIRQTYELACAEWEKSVKALKVRLEMAATPARLLPITDPLPPVAEGCVRVFACVAECMGKHVSEKQREGDNHYCDIYFPEVSKPDPLELERLAFEEWCKSQDLSTSKDAEGDYAAFRTIGAWFGWQASAARNKQP